MDAGEAFSSTSELIEQIDVISQSPPWEEEKRNITLQLVYFYHFMYTHGILLM